MGMFLYGYVVGFREALETAMLAAIALGALSRLGRRDLQRHVWYGIGAAALASVGLVRLSLDLGGFLEGRPGRIFEATMMTITVVLLTGIITWLHQQARAARGALEARLLAAAARNGMAVALLAFVLVLREGIESTILLWGGIAMGVGQGVLEGSTAGITTACLVAFLFFRRTSSFKPQKFFRVSGAVLLVFAAAILSNAVRSWQDVGLLPPLLAPIWDTSHLLDEDSPLGSLAQVILGYSDHPSLLQFGSWLAYLTLVGRTLISCRWRGDPRRRSRAPDRRRGG